LPPGIVFGHGQFIDHDLVEYKWFDLPLSTRINVIAHLGEMFKNPSGLGIIGHLGVVRKREPILPVRLGAHRSLGKTLHVVVMDPASHLFNWTRLDEFQCEALLEDAHHTDSPVVTAIIFRSGEETPEALVLIGWNDDRSGRGDITEETMGLEGLGERLGIGCSANENKIEFAGAHRPLYILREGELTIFKGDRKAIGGLRHPKKKETDFETHEYSYRRGDKIFFFSDGLTDQMGGPDGNKYSPSRVRDILLKNPGFTIRQFHKFFEYDFSTWLGNERQLDDVLLIGIEF